MSRHDSPNLNQRVSVLAKSDSGRLVQRRLLDAAVEQRFDRGTTAMALRGLMVESVAERLDEWSNASSQLLGAMQQRVCECLLESCAHEHLQP